MRFTEVIAWTLPIGNVKQVKTNNYKIWEEAESVDQLSAPLVELDSDGHTLIMTNTDSNTAAYTILVNGVKKVTVECDDFGIEPYALPRKTYTLPRETYTVSGTWYFNLVLDLPTTEISQFVRFRSSPFNHFGNSHNSYSRMRVGFNLGKQMRWTGCTENGYDVLWAAIYGVNAGWHKEAYRTITFDGVQEVSKEFYDWFTANAVSSIR